MSFKMHLIKKFKLIYRQVIIIFFSKLSCLNNFAYYCMSMVIKTMDLRCFEKKFFLTLKLSSNSKI